MAHQMHATLSSTEVDVVIIGGGVQGLVALNALIEEGYSCALVSDGDLGSGQTLHSHGVLNTGFGFAGPELQRASIELVQPDLVERGLELGQEWVFIPPPGFPVPAGLPATTLPPGFAPSFAETAVIWSDKNFPKRGLVEALSQTHKDRVLLGHATPKSTGERVESVAVRISATGEEVLLSTKTLIVAAGCGTKRVLQDLVGQTPQIDKIKHRRVHMICVRAPRGSLPTTSIGAMPLALLLVAHDQPDNVTWYVTPMEFGGPSYDDVPGDAAGDIDPATVARGFASLLALYPRLPETRGLQLGCYAGYRQDIGDLPGTPLCELLEGTENVVMALPSGLIGPWLNVTRMSEIVGGLVDPSRNQLSLPGGGAGVRVGSAVEDRPDFVWMGWDEWLRTYPLLSDPR
jgi:glycine/D-amino acid oxidase-like deaminating enzyme